VIIGLIINTRFMRNLLNVLILLVFSTICTHAQTSCYNWELDKSGVSVSEDSLQRYSCLLSNTLPAGVSGGFQVFSVVEYTLDEYKHVGGRNRVYQRMLDSINTAVEYNLVFSWETVGENNFGGCDVSLSYPNDDEYQNCFTLSKIAVLEALVKEYLVEQIETRSADIRIFREIELGAVNLLIGKINQINQCCAGEDKNDDSCSLCPSEEELDVLQVSVLKLHKYETGIQLSDEVDYAVFSESTTLTEKFSFFDYTGKGGLAFGDVFIDLRAELEGFTEGIGAAAKPTVYLMNKEAFCYTSIDENNPDQTIIYIDIDNGDVDLTLTKKSSLGQILLMSRSDVNNSDFFLNYIIDKYPQVFGFLLDFSPGRGDAGEEVGGEQEDQSEYCFYTPTGVLLYGKDYTGESTYGINSVELHKFTDVNPFNTVRSFEFKSSGYKALSRKRDRDFHAGYYNVGEIERVLADSVALTDLNLATAFFYSQPDVRPYGIVDVGGACKVTAYKNHGCAQGVRKCQWGTVSTTKVEIGPKQAVPFNEEAPCGAYEEGYDEVCCVLGGRYLNLMINNPDLSSTLAVEMATQAGSDKLKEIGSIICDIGSTYFGDYDTSPWEELPDAIKIYFDNSLLRIAPDGCEGEECTLGDFLEKLENYRDRVAELTSRWDVNDPNAWRGLLIVLRGYEEADFAFLSAYQRFELIKALSNNIDCDYWSPVPCYGTDEYNEKAIVRLITYQSPSQSETCQFVGLLLNSEDLLNKLFEGMSDPSFLEGGKDDYYDFILSLVTLIKSNGTCSQVMSLENMSINQAINLGYFKPPWDPIVGGYCDIRVEGDCFGDIKVNMPFPYPVNFGNNLSAPPLTYLCVYSFNPFGLTSGEDIEIKVNGPLDYVPVNIISHNYASGLLPKGLHLVPSFLLCYLRDYSVNASTRQKITAIINVAVIGLTIPTLGSTSIPIVLRIIGAIDAAGTIAFSEVNNQIETGQSRGYFDDGQEGTEDYNRFINSYRRVEQIFNYAMITGAVVEVVPAAARGLIRAVSKMSIPPGSLDGLLANRIVSLNEASNALLFQDLNQIENLLNRYPDGALLRTRLASLEESALKQLDEDLLRMSPIERIEFGDALLTSPNGFSSYQLLSILPPSTSWRLDPNIIRQLGADITESPLLRGKLLEDGPDGVRVWKLIDDNAPNPVWCPIN
jgi:hypothetical protein